MAYELTGTVKLIGELQTFNSGFSKKEMVVTVEDGNYPQDISLEFLKEKAELLNNVNIGQTVTVTFDIRGREYNGRYFNNLVGWQIKDAAQNNEDHTPSTGFDDMPADVNFDDDIPF